jgi:hypothetical protein
MPRAPSRHEARGNSNSKIAAAIEAADHYLLLFLIRLPSHEPEFRICFEEEKYHGRAEARPHASVKTRAMLSLFHDAGGTAPG